LFQENGAYYLNFEAALAFFAVTFIVLRAVTIIGRKWGLTGHLRGYVCMIGVPLLAFMAWPASPFLAEAAFWRYPVDQEQARALSKSLIGNSQIVGGRITQWYISGADYWWDMRPQLTYNLQTRFDDQFFFSAIDYLVETRPNSEESVEPRHTTLGSHYLERDLGLAGIVLGRRDATHVALFSRRHSFRGAYAVGHEKVARFVEGQSGSIDLVASYCKRADFSRVMAALQARPFAKSPGTAEFSSHVHIMLNQKYLWDGAPDNQSSRNHDLIFYFDNANSRTLDEVEGCRRVETRHGRLVATPVVWPAEQKRSMVFDRTVVERQMLRAERFRLADEGRNIMPYIRRQGATERPCPEMCFDGARGTWAFQASLAPEAFSDYRGPTLLRLNVRIRSGVLAVTTYDENDQGMEPLRFDVSPEVYDVVIPIPEPHRLSRRFPVGLSTYENLLTADFDIVSATLHPMKGKSPAVK
jgi:hypothetical protein